MQPQLPMNHRPLTPLLGPGIQIRVIWLALGNVALVEIASHSGPDAIVLDLQHGLWDRHTLEAAVGIANTRVPVIARVADLSATAIATALDAGAGAVLAPMVETADDARRVVAAGRYPPLGQRSAGGVRPLMHGLDAMREADRHIALGALIVQRHVDVRRHVQIAFSRVHLPREHAQQGRLARTIRADERDTVTRIHGQ